MHAAVPGCVEALQPSLSLETIAPVSSATVVPVVRLSRRQTKRVARKTLSTSTESHSESKHAQEGSHKFSSVESLGTPRGPLSSRLVSPEMSLNSAGNREKVSRAANDATAEESFGT